MGRNKNKARRSAQRAIRQQKKSNYLETDDAETVNYNDNIYVDNISAYVNVGSDEYLIPKQLLMKNLL